MRRTTRTILLVLLAAHAGCAGSEASDATTPGSVSKGSAIEAMGITGPDVPWDEMSFADKEFYMIGKVNPIMQELFARYDAEEYGNFDCETCHGDEMREIEFKMPAPSMYIVPPEGTPGHRGMLATFPDTVAFMEETVTPIMGKLLGVEGLTCTGCHPSAPPKKELTAVEKSR